MLVSNSMAGLFSRGEEVTSAPLIPRSILFGNPDHAQIRVSPDGRYLSRLSPVDNVLNLHISPIDDLSSDTLLTHEKGRGIPSHSWAWTGKHILYPKDKDGDENDHLYCVDIEKGTTRDLTPFKTVKAKLMASSRNYPEEIIIGRNDRDPQYHDLWRLNIVTGETTMILENKEKFAGFEIDEDLNVRLGSRYLDNGDYGYWKLNPDDTWTTYVVIEADDIMTFSFCGFDKTGKKIRVVDSRNRNTAALFEWDFDTTKSVLIAEDTRADISEIMVNPITLEIEAVGIEYDRAKWILITDAVAKDMKRIDNLTEGDAIVTARSNDDSFWTVSCMRDDGPVEFYLYDRKKEQARLLCVSKDALVGKPLAKMTPVIILTRDDKEMVSYLTLPVDAPTSSVKGFPETPQPMVLLVHGGPIARDHWGYNAKVQLLANRGYAVLQTNFRGSSGFGKAFIQSSIKQWGAAMQDDLVDAVKWAVDNGIADPNRIAIMGTSYGGYATLVGLTRDVDLFAAGVDIVGPSNLETLLATIPPYWVPAVKYFHRFVGDPDTTEGIKLLKERSPLTYAERIKKPLLIGQGQNDPRVKRSESDQIAKSMKKHGLPLIYVLYTDEGHGFARPENNISFMAITELFLQKHLGGRAEPVENAFTGSSLQILEDSDNLTSGLFANSSPKTGEKK